MKMTTVVEMKHHNFLLIEKGKRRGGGLEVEREKESNFLEEMKERSVIRYLRGYDKKER